jgi:hypothetical protein
MYVWIWRHLPGPIPVRVVISCALVFAVVAALFLWVFPWVEPRLPFTDVTVDSSGRSFSTELSTGWGQITRV